MYSCHALLLSSYVSLCLCLIVLCLLHSALIFLVLVLLVSRSILCCSCFFLSSGFYSLDFHWTPGSSWFLNSLYLCLEHCMFFVFSFLPSNLLKLCLIHILSCLHLGFNPVLKMVDITESCFLFLIPRHLAQCVVLFYSSPPFGNPPEIF